MKKRYLIFAFSFCFAYAEGKSLDKTKKENAKKVLKKSKKRRKKIKRAVNRQKTSLGLRFYGEYLNDSQKESGEYGFSIPSSILKMVGVRKGVSYSFEFEGKMNGYESELKLLTFAFDIRLSKRVNLRVGKMRVPSSRNSLYDELSFDSPFRLTYFSYGSSVYKTQASEFLGNEESDEGVVFWGVDKPFKNIFFKYYIGVFNGRDYGGETVNLKRGRFVSRFELGLYGVSKTYEEAGYRRKNRASIGVSLVYDPWYFENGDENGGSIFNYEADFMFFHDFSSFSLDFVGGYTVFDDKNEELFLGYNGVFSQLGLFFPSIKLKFFALYERYDYETEFKNYWSIVSGGLGYRLKKGVLFSLSYSYYRRHHEIGVDEIKRISIGGFFRF